MITACPFTTAIFVTAFVLLASTFGYQLYVTNAFRGHKDRVWRLAYICLVLLAVGFDASLRIFALSGFGVPSALLTGVVVPLWAAVTVRLTMGRRWNSF